MAPQVGTLHVPLRCLLRQGRPAVEALLRAPVSDQGKAVARLDSDGSACCLRTEPLRGSFVLRLACAGQQSALLAREASAGGSSVCGSPCRTPSPRKQQQQQGGVAGVLVRARPALEEAGRLAREVARREGVSG